MKRCRNKAPTHLSEMTYVGLLAASAISKKFPELANMARDIEAEIKFRGLNLNRFNRNVSSIIEERERKDFAAAGTRPDGNS